ncbi:MAG: hypothetical protein V7661_06170 [Sulfitobacter sp.]
MTVISPVEEIDVLELKVAASCAINKKVVARHVRRLNAAAGLTTVLSGHAIGEDRLRGDELVFDNAPV